MPTIRPMNLKGVQEMSTLTLFTAKHHNDFRVQVISTLYFTPYFSSLEV